jgi:hypothetical protein
MESTKPLDEQMTTNLAKVGVRSQDVSQTLAHDGWFNADGCKGAFLYPMSEVERTADAIVAVAEAYSAGRRVIIPRA